MTDALFVLLAAVVATGGVALWITLQVPLAERPVVAAYSVAISVLVCVAVTIAYHRSEQVRQIRGRARALEAEFARLVDETLPTAAQRLREGASVETVIAETPQPLNAVHQRLLRGLMNEISIGERRRAATTAACASAAARVQAMATSMLADLREMEGRHSEEMLGDLLKLDHSTAQTGRLADSIAVLTGARSGRRWTKPIVMESILRGAMGRIGAYQRVRVHSTCTAAIAGYAAEDVMHALAELMDNATRFSAPSEEVHVYVEELHSGVVVTIEDGGLGMKPQALERAKAAVSATEPLDLTTLSGTRLGLAVVGCLARKHQLHIFFRPSSRGGTGVVVRIPNQLVLQPRWDSLHPEPESPVPVAAIVSADPTTVVLDGERGSLPRRNRGQTLAAVTQSLATADPRAPRSRVDIGARFNAFREGSRSGRLDGDAPPAPSPGVEDGAE